MQRSKDSKPNLAGGIAQSVSCFDSPTLVTIDRKLGVDFARAKLFRELLRNCCGARTLS
jgi:hypothetical protein